MYDWLRRVTFACGMAALSAAADLSTGSGRMPAFPISEPGTGQVEDGAQAAVLFLADGWPAQSAVANGGRALETVSPQDWRRSLRGVVFASFDLSVVRKSLRVQPNYPRLPHSSGREAFARALGRGFNGAVRRRGAEARDDKHH